MDLIGGGKRGREEFEEGSKWPVSFECDGLIVCM